MIHNKTPHGQMCETKKESRSCTTVNISMPFGQAQSLYAAFAPLWGHCHSASCLGLSNKKMYGLNEHSESQNFIPAQHGQTNIISHILNVSYTCTHILHTHLIMIIYYFNIWVSFPLGIKFLAHGPEVSIICNRLSIGVCVCAVGICL